MKKNEDGLSEHGCGGGGGELAGEVVVVIDGQVSEEILRWGGKESKNQAREVIKEKTNEGRAKKEIKVEEGENVIRKEWKEIR